MQIRIGDEQKASGALATLLTVAAYSQFKVQSIYDLAIPEVLPANAHELIEEALDRRPDLLARVAQIDAAKAEERDAKKAYYPKLTFDGNFGRLRAWWDQTLYPAACATGNVYDATLRLSWNVFDGGSGKAALRRRRPKKSERKVSCMRREIKWKRKCGMLTWMRRQRCGNARRRRLCSRLRRNRTKCRWRRANVRAWQPQLRTLLVLQITLAHMRLAEPEGRLPAHVEAKQEACARYLDELADLLDPGGQAVEQNSTGTVMKETAGEESVAESIAVESLEIVRELIMEVRRAAAGGTAPK